MAADRTSPNGRVIGIDIIPAQPPKGVSTLQGNFLSQKVQNEVKNFLKGSDRGRTKPERSFITSSSQDQMTEEDLEERSLSYLQLERRVENDFNVDKYEDSSAERQSQAARDSSEGRLVDVILSDMSEPWAQTDGFWKRSLSDPYFRMMNASGNNFRDHAGSMVRYAGTYQNFMIMIVLRIFAMRPCDLPSIPFAQVATSFANSTKEARTKYLSFNSKRFSVKCTEKSPTRLEAYLSLLDLQRCKTDSIDRNLKRGSSWPYVEREMLRKLRSSQHPRTTSIQQIRS